MSNFDPNAILRGAQLTLVGANRALQNPGLFKHDHYRQAAIAVAVGILIQVLLSLPIALVRFSLWFIDLFTNLEAQTWDDQLIKSMNTLQHSVLQIPFFLMHLVKFFSPALDDMFMEALDFVDKTYLAKHKSDNPSSLRAIYYPNLSKYRSALSSSKAKKSRMDGLIVFLIRYGRKAALSLAIYGASFTPVIGRFVLPAASFYTFHKAVGTKPAVAIFASGLVIPRHHFVKFIQTYFASRSMMRELLHPYFSRVPFTSQQKKRWFKDREGVLFGFGVGFFLMVKIPLFGVLIYGIAEASTAYLITKITDPPPPPENEKARLEFAEKETTWRNKIDFLSVPLSKLDSYSAKAPVERNPADIGPPRKQFT